MSRTRRAASAWSSTSEPVPQLVDTPPPARSSVSSSPAQSFGQSGFMQIHRQTSVSAWLRLGSIGSPPESQVRAKDSGMGTSLARG